MLYIITTIYRLTNNTYFIFLHVLFTEEQLKTVCLDLLIAGSQTTGNTLEFALLQVLRDTSVQDNIHEEIDRVIGDRMPCWADNAKYAQNYNPLNNLKAFHYLYNTIQS